MLVWCGDGEGDVRVVGCVVCIVVDVLVVVDCCFCFVGVWWD